MGSVKIGTAPELREGQSLQDWCDENGGRLDFVPGPDGEQYESDWCGDHKIDEAKA